MTEKNDERRAKAIEVAGRYIGQTTFDAKQNVEYLEALDAYYIYQPARGGSAVVVSPDGSFLFATSQVAPEEHQAAFSEGRRTDPALFE